LVDCVVTGYKGRDVVTITDKKTGKTRPYSQKLADNMTPFHLRLQDYAEVDRIVVTCTMYGTRGDRIICRAETANGHTAPMFESIGMDGDADRTGKAKCRGTINARS